MKNPFKVITILFLLLIGSYGKLYAQSGTWTITEGWRCPTCTHDAIIFSPNNNSTTQAVFNFYNSWTTLDYNFTTAQNFSNAVLNLDLRSNFSGKYAFVHLTDGTNSTALSTTTILPIPNSTTSAQYSIDFNTVKGSCNMASITKLKIMLYNDFDGRTAPVNLAGNLNISFQIAAGATGVSTTTPNSISDLWQLSTSNLIFNKNTVGVLLGSNPSGVDNRLLSFPYYAFTVKGRTNIIGNDNALEIWSNTIPTNGIRHYLGISNAAFSGGVEYSMINSGEYGSGVYNLKPLVLQNYLSPTGSGNLGIGYHTSAPTEKLSVNGNIKCKKLITTGAGWADYVFDSNYKLMSLLEVKKFIALNNHLPNIPSESEVEANGLDTGEMMKLQMEKIEELTLYMIKQQEEIDLLKKQIEALCPKE